MKLRQALKIVIDRIPLANELGDEAENRYFQKYNKKTLSNVDKRLDKCNIDMYMKIANKILRAKVKKQKEDR